VVERSSSDIIRKLRIVLASSYKLVINACQCLYAYKTTFIAFYLFVAGSVTCNCSTFYSPAVSCLICVRRRSS